MHHLIQQMSGPRGLGRVRDFIDEPHVLGCIAGIEQEETLPGQAIASRPAGFLVVAFQVFRHVVMDDKADVGFVDPHAEGNGGAHHPDTVAEILFLIARPLRLFQPGMIGEGRDAIRAEPRREGLRSLAGQAINDAAVLGTLA